MSAPAPESQWYYVNDEDQVGPLAKDQLIRAVEKGIVKPDTLVWRNGLKDWVEASQVKFLSFASANPFAVTGRDSDEEEDNEEEEDRPRKKKKKKKRIQYGSFWNRLVGFVVDGISVGVIYIAVCFVIGVFIGVSGAQVDLNSPIVSLVFYIIYFTIYFLYFACLESSEAQASFGKMAAGTKVVDENGDRLSFLRASGRSVGRLLSTFTLGIGFLLMPFTEKKQAMHDLMAGTLVIKS